MKRCRTSIAELFALGVLASALAGCVRDVPHENPYDLLSANPIVVTTLSGRVVMKNQTNAGVPGATVTLMPMRLSAITDTEGAFAFGDIPDSVSTIVIVKEGFAPDTLAVSLPRGGARTLTAPLNAVPTVKSVRIVTRKIDQWWPNPMYSASVSASADDANGLSDVDTVWAAVDTLRFGMTYSVTSKNFEAVITPADLPTNSLEWLIGKAFTIIARDMDASVGVSQQAFAARIIENEAAPVYPAAEDTASASPLFTWTPPPSEFPFTYTITVVRVDAGTQSVVWTKAGLGSYLRSFQYPNALQQGLYFWTIAVVDEFGDMAQSKESSFIVK